jgi:hypothetical protein
MNVEDFFVSAFYQGILPSYAKSFGGRGASRVFHTHSAQDGGAGGLKDYFHVPPL